MRNGRSIKRPVRLERVVSDASRGDQKAQYAGDPDTGETYYRHWLAALERIVAAKGVATPAALARYRHGWAHAASRTPHGQPIELTAGDLNSAADPE